MKTIIIAALVAAGLALGVPASAEEYPTQISLAVISGACESSSQTERDGCNAYILGVMQATHFWGNLNGYECGAGRDRDQWLEMVDELKPVIHSAVPEWGDQSAASMIAVLYIQRFGCASVNMS